MLERNKIFKNDNIVLIVTVKYHEIILTMDKMGKHSQNSEMGRKKSETKGMSTPPSVQQVQMPTTVIPPSLPWTPPNASGTLTSHMLNQVRGALYMQHPQNPQGISQQMINEPVVAISSGPIMHVDNGQYTTGITPGTQKVLHRYSLILQLINNNPALHSVSNKLFNQTLTNFP